MEILGILLLVTFGVTLLPVLQGSEIRSLSFQYISGKKKVTYLPTGTPCVSEDSHLKFTLHGTLAPNTYFRMVTHPKDCALPLNLSKDHKVTRDPSGLYGTVRTVVPLIAHSEETSLIYYCLGRVKGRGMELQGLRSGEKNVSGPASPSQFYPWLVLLASRPFLSDHVQYMIVAALLMFSGLFSGLNLGILSLDQMDLKLLINTGPIQQQNYAKSIQPVREHGNLLLCTLVLSNVLVNAIITLMLDNLTDGITAAVLSTLGIVLFGEIIPQAVCSKHGLAVGGSTIWITKLFIVITFPVSYPMSKVLEFALGDEIGVSFNRERLSELIKVVKDEHQLESEEADIISGTLELKKKTVKSIMKKIGDVFMLSVDTKLDGEIMNRILTEGYSRIPIYEGELANVIAVLNTKQLILVDFKDKVDLKDIINLEYFKDHLFCVFENTTLDFMYRKFREGKRGHIAFVDRIVDDGPGEPFLERIGIVTMEDVLEELLQQDIMDEADMQRRNRIVRTLLSRR